MYSKEGIVIAESNLAASGKEVLRAKSRLDVESIALSDCTGAQIQVLETSIKAVKEDKIRLKCDALDDLNIVVNQAKLNVMQFTSKEFINRNTTKQLLLEAVF